LIFSVYVSTSGSRILFDSLHSLAVPGRQCFNMSSRKAERSEVYPGSRSRSILLLGPGYCSTRYARSQFRDDKRNNVQFTVPGRQCFNMSSRAETQDPRSDLHGAYLPRQSRRLKRRGLRERNPPANEDPF